MQCGAEIAYCTVDRFILEKDPLAGLENPRNLYQTIKNKRPS
jgi:hypothetical protein